jgi:hypothetical protein
MSIIDFPVYQDKTIGNRIFLQMEKNEIDEYINILHQFVEDGEQVYITSLDMSDNLEFLNEVYIKHDIKCTDIQGFLKQLSCMFYTDYIDQVLINIMPDYQHALLYREDLEKCIIYTEKPDTYQVINKTSGFKYIRGYNLTDREYTIFSNFLKGKRYRTVDHILEKIDSIEVALDINQKPVDHQIAEYINNNYLFHKNSSYKIKFNEISNTVYSKIDSVNIQYRSFQKLLSKVLEEKGCKKKRFTDGIYFIDISLKKPSVSKSFQNFYV